MLKLKKRKISSYNSYNQTLLKDELMTYKKTITQGGNIDE